MPRAWTWAPIFGSEEVATRSVPYPPVTLLQAGSIVAGYRLEREVGGGGMGVVWRARDLRLERPVALKLIRPEIAADRGFRERFTREARLAAALDHAHVLPVYEAGEAAGGELFLAMRFVDGHDLATLLAAEHRLEAGRASRLLAQVALALDAAHAEGLVHRDVKPANILIATQDGEEHAYLSDFGLTIEVAAEERLTVSGLFLGTVSYAAPEQLRAERVDARTDVYALGCVLYQCLTGEVPYPRDSDSAAMLAHLSDPVPRASDRSPVPAGCLRRDRRSRTGQGARGSLPVRRRARADGRPGRGRLRCADLPSPRDAGRSTPPASARTRGARLVPMTIALVVATLAGIAVAAGAPWKEESGRGTSARAQTAGERAQAKERAAAVRSICTGVNAENAALPERYRRLNARLDRGAVTLRVGLIEEINRQLRGGDALLARLEAIPPADAAARTLQAGTEATWSGSLDRLRRVRDALERARSERAVVRAAMTSRSTAERDRRRIRAGLLALRWRRVPPGPAARSTPDRGGRQRRIPTCRRTRCRPTCRRSDRGTPRAGDGIAHTHRALTRRSTTCPRSSRCSGRPEPHAW